MDPFRKTKTVDEENLNESEVLEATEISEDGLDEETGLVSGEVSEIAKDNASENKAQAQGKKGDDDTSNAQKEQKAQVDLSDRMALRDRLLATAPQESAMRNEVKHVLLKKKEALEQDVKKYKHNYALLSDAMMQLRAVVKQLAALAHASYEALKETWLKVVHRFA